VGGTPALEIGRGGNNPSLYITYVKKHSYLRLLLWRQKNSEVKYSTTQISEVQGFQGSIAQQEKRELKQGLLILVLCIGQGHVTQQQRNN